MELPDDQPVGKSQLIARRLEENYRLLHRQYRLGNCEGSVGYVQQWPIDEDSVKFYDLCDERKPAAQPISFTEAIDDLYRLVTYLEQHQISIDGVLLLRCKCLVYEATDYLLRVPKELGEYFSKFASSFSGVVSDAEKEAEKLNCGPIPNRDERAKVIKLQLIAAIWGANQLYREHRDASYDKARVVLEKVNNFILSDLPAQHESPRESFGIRGLAQYMTGLVLFRKGMSPESRNAFHDSADAYLARIKQKEDFLRRKLITPQEYEEKIAVTIRRSALVAAFGDGYFYFVNGQLTKALESLTVARAALSRNAGRVYQVYAEMLYWACQVAARSSNLNRVEEAIRELRKCRDYFDEIIPDSRYFHRAGIQVAIALLYRVRILRDATGPDYQEGLGYLNDAEEFSRKPESDRDFCNPSLFAVALVTKSRYLRTRAGQERESQPQQAYKWLDEAKTYAMGARQVATVVRTMQSQASATLGQIYVDLARLDLEHRKGEFKKSFSAALECFERARKQNRAHNPRNDALCLLGLTRLCLLHPNTEIAARDYFSQWKAIEDLVEHDYCKTMAKQLEESFNPRNFLIEIGDSLNLKHWSDKLERHLVAEALKEFVGQNVTKKLTKKQLRAKLKVYLHERIGFGTTKASEITKQELLAKVEQMLNFELGLEPVAKER